MGFFSTDKASNGANQRGFSGKDKAKVTKAARKVSGLQKQVNNKTQRATNQQGNKGKR